MSPRPRRKPVPRRPAASFDDTFRAMIRREVESLLQPVHTALSRLQAGTAEMTTFRQLADRLSPLTSIFNGVGGARRGRPPGSGRGRGRGKDGLARDRGCAIIGCKRPSRTKGYCAAHYQKLRMLTRSNRRPAGWVDFAQANSIPDVVLPRGRAAHKSRSPRQEA